MIERLFARAPAICLALLIAGCTTEPSLYSGKTGYYAYTWEQEIEIGRKADAQTVQQMGLYHDDAITDYVRQLGQSLLEQSALRAPDAPEMYRETEFTFRVLDSPVVNAFALPGGYVYVTRGLLAHAENEAQLAVVLGHEITHVEARHASKQALKQQWGQLGLAAGAIIGQELAENKELARSIVDMSGDLFQLVTLKYGRDAERESDLHGVEYAAKAGYDAAQGSGFFRTLQRMSEKSGQSIPSWMSTHPDPGEREKTIAKLADSWRGAVPMETVGREEYLKRIEGLVVGENPRNGYVADGLFYHPDMKFQFQPPAGWKLQNEGSAVYSADPSGNALLVLSIAEQATALDAASALTQGLKLEIVGANQSNINGLPSYQLEGSAPTQSGNLPVYATFIEYSGKVFSLLGYGTPTGFAASRGAIAQAIGSFQELTNQQALNIQPRRLEIVPASREAPFRDLLPADLPPGMDAQDWAIINQVELDQAIAPGTLLKLPARP